MDSANTAGGGLYVPAQVVSPAAPKPRRSSSGWWIVLLLLAGVAAAVLVAAAAAGSLGQAGDLALQEKYHSLARGGHEKIAIITVSGAIMDDEGFIRKQIDRVREDEHVRGIVLRIDSPGGTINASDNLYHYLRQMAEDRELPMVVSMGGLCASGGYYLAMAVGDTPDSIFAEPSTWTGSIGVIIPHYDLAGLLQKWEVSEDSIKSHQLKDLGSPFRKMNEQERGILQSLVDEGFTRFKEVVVAGRPKFKDNAEALAQVATGQVFTANQALAAGLVDRVGHLEEAIDRVIELAALTGEREKDNVKVIRYKRHVGLLDQVLMGADARASRWPSVESLLTLSTPRAYYLWSWDPALVATANAPWQGPLQGE